ncbi:26S proteasome regulatory subunit 6A-A-like [Culex pipiens pallens]|uniref:26S proteasome regulatory subunit 6A-A-like n=1 Tax=Culex pipiens pallens TaxID=42434 RepID=UPI0022AADAED|nr:26S proteasome regulatory subunit 6A-A-like [Culex pipiens pallens]
MDYIIKRQTVIAYARTADCLQTKKNPFNFAADRAVVVLDYQRKGKRPVIKTTTRQTYFLLVIGLVVPEKLKPGDESEQGLVRRTSSWTLPAEVDERPTEHYSDIGGLDKQILELIEAVVVVQMFIGDSFKLVRDAFALAKEKSPAITSCTRLRCKRI